MSLPLLNDKTIKHTGKGQLAEGMFHRQFPDRYRTQQHFIRTIGKHLTDREREFTCICDDL
jgi:hypothetical protein